MIELLALAVVVLTGLYFCALAAASLIMPARASRFLLAFASSPRVHYLELLIRLVVGVSLVIHSPRMVVPAAFSLIGWILIVTTACLLLLPWRWHRRFAQRAVPPATRYIAWIGLCSLALGGLILLAVLWGGTA